MKWCFHFRVCECVCLYAGCRAPFLVQEPKFWVKGSSGQTQNVKTGDALPRCHDFSLPSNYHQGRVCPINFLWAGSTNSYRQQCQLTVDNVRINVLPNTLNCTNLVYKSRTLEISDISLRLIYHYWFKFQHDLYIDNSIQREITSPKHSGDRIKTVYI